MIVLSRMSLEASGLRIGTFKEELMQKNPTWPSPQPYQHKYYKTKNEPKCNSNKTSWPRATRPLSTQVMS